jgi:Protein of unknown function (DUF2569)
MNSLKCPQCGMVNFTSTPACKRCQLEFGESLVSEAEAIRTDAVAYQYWPPRQVTAEKTEPDWEAFSERLRSGMEEPFEEPASHSAGTIFFAVCLMITQVALLIQVPQYLNLGAGGEWYALTNPRSNLYAPVYEKLYWLEVSYKSLAFVIQLILLWGFFAKSRTFMRVVYVYLVSLFVFVLLEWWGFAVFERTLREKHLGATFDARLDSTYWVYPFCFISVLIVVLWFFYFRTSERVKRIFIH